MTKKFLLSFIMLFVFFSAAFANDLPRVAVYVTGELGVNEKRAFASRMLVSLINTGRYIMGEERPNQFFAEVEGEHGESESITDSQISDLGRRFGINHVCIIDVSPLFDGYQILARIVDAETVEVLRIGDSYSPLRTADDLLQACDDLVKVMSRGRVARSESRPEPESEPVAQPPSIEPRPEPVTGVPVVPAPLQTRQPPLPVYAAPAAAPASQPQAAVESKWPPKAAVYVTGLNAALSNALSRAVTSALIKANIYERIERIDQHITGTPTDNSIIAAGKRAGVDFVFVINVSGQINVRIIDVDLGSVPANISLSGRMNSPLDAGKMAVSIVNFILKDGPKPPPGYVAPAPVASAGRTTGGAAESEGRRSKFSLGTSVGTAAVEPHFRLGISEHSRFYFGTGFNEKRSVSETHVGGFIEWHTNSTLSVYGGPGMMMGFYKYERDWYRAECTGFVLGLQGGFELRLGWFLLGTEWRLGYFWREWDSGGMRSIGIRTGIAF
ncbi:MAG: hypothetical protein FWE57_11665 [Chitinispirillia bacterium]|nr:hypothetical protein [Chitinispirillia bacterium]